MATDPGVVDAYLTALQSELDRRQAELGQLREQLKAAKLEQVALALLQTADSQLLATAGIAPRLDGAALSARANQLLSEIAAIRNLAAAVKGAA